MRGPAALGLLLVPACLTPVVPGGPPFEDGTTLVLQIVPAPGAPELYAYDPAAPMAPEGRRTLPPEGELVVLGYRGPDLRSLGLLPGLQARTSEGRPIPNPDYRLRFSNGAWQTEPASVERLLDVRLPPTGAGPCAQAGQCYSTAAGTCLDCDPTLVIEDPVAPDPPRPLLAACRQGWSRVGPEDRPACTLERTGACGAGEVQLPGDSACQPLGMACPPAGQFPPAGPGRTVYVAEGAPAGGTGAEGAPFRLLEEALLAAQAGDRVALAAGSYTFPSGAIPGPVELVGACAAQVVVGGGGVTLREVGLSELTVRAPLRVRGTVTATAVRYEAPAPLQVGVGARLQARRLVLQGNLQMQEAQVSLHQAEIAAVSGPAVIQEGGRLLAERIALAALGPDGAGLYATAGRVELRDFRIEAAGAGLTAQGATVELLGGELRTGAHGLFLTGAGTTQVRGLWIQEAPTYGIVALGPALWAEDLRVEGAPVDPSAAVYVERSPSAVLRRVAVQGTNQGLRSVGTPLAVEDAVIEDLVLRGSDNFRTAGIQINATGASTVTRARIEGFVGLGVAVAGLEVEGVALHPGRITLEDVEVLDLTADAPGDGGVGFFEEGAVEVVVRCFRGQRLGSRGLQIRGFPESEFLGEDLRLVDTNVGVERSGPGGTTLRRVNIEGVRDRGLEIRGDPLNVEALSISGADGHRGVSLEPDGLGTRSLELTRFRIAGRLRAGVVANGGVSRIRLRDGQIRGVDFAFGLPAPGTAFSVEDVEVILEEGQQPEGYALP